MITRNGQPFVIIVVVLTTLSILLSSCAPRPTVAPPLPSTAALTPTDTPQPTATPVPLPVLAWHAGDSYFSLNGRPAFLFSRNPAGYVPEDWATLAGMAHQQGDHFLRVYTSNSSMGGDHGYGYTPTGEILEDWSNNWEHFFDVAEADGLYVIPSFWGWIDWNNTGYNTWANNPFNSANGGPAQDPREIYQKDSPTQLLYLKWFKSLVTRWQAHKNILAWEVVSEVNLINGISQPEGIYFTGQLAQVVREADSLHRPVTASVADWSGWSDFLHTDAFDFVNFHPYPPDGDLDRRILEQVPLLLNTYHKPVLIGESGLNAATPDSADGKITVAPNSRTGLQHAIWAQLVSGAMNGRALWWEDGYGIYFPALGMPWVQKFTDVEAPVVRFVEGMDMTGFKPTAARASDKIFGAALGNEEMIIGWYRDATSEPPDWNLQPVVSKQTVALTVPGSASIWKVDFYDTKNGTTVLSSASITSQGNTITILLPDFQDDIAFKMTAQTGTASTSASAIVTTDPIAGTWSGTISNLAGTFSTSLKLSIQAGCMPGKVCGTFSAPQVPCTGDLFLQTINAATFLFLEQNASGAASCKSGGYEQIQLLADGTLSYEYLTSPGSAATSTGILKNP